MPALTKTDMGNEIECPVDQNRGKFSHERFIG